MIAITNATIFNGKGEVIENHMILVQDGKIESVTAQEELDKSYQVIDAKGKIVTPGLIDVHTHLGISEEGVGKEGHDFNETSDAVTPQVRAIDGINPMEPGFGDARKAGVTTVQVMPGSANVIGGEMVVLKTVGTIVDEMVIKSPSGMKAATGENPKKYHGEKGRMPVTRMGVAALLREKLIEAQNYINSGQKERKLGLENLAKVLNKEVPLRVHAHRADDILTVLRLKREFDIDVTIEHCTEGQHIAEFIAKHDVRVSVGPTLSTRSKVELKDKDWTTIKVLLDAGVPCSLTTDHPVVGIDYLVTSAIHAIRNGITEQQALTAITLDAAKHLGVEDRVGSIEPGKDADLVIWSGNPFDLRSIPEKVFIDGEVVN
ncbi:amidohydrolase [Planomicrobium chinense]|uniref:amidohydrolase n=1 Tax=Planococcus chinensis TaxID=272917 RepID=UPI001CC52B1F|nr:amidohydrolase [Planococcus chinensis]MBZ5202708.1 amidohydrolase [Planococcus chinensis]MCP2035700.1 imidazolonepropionase-like amidohydrolase [Planomicrobium sp. HSC-17F08]